MNIRVPAGYERYLKKCLFRVRYYTKQKQKGKKKLREACGCDRNFDQSARPTLDTDAQGRNDIFNHWRHASIWQPFTWHASGNPFHFGNESQINIGQIKYNDAPRMYACVCVNRHVFTAGQMTTSRTGSTCVNIRTHLGNPVLQFSGSKLVNQSPAVKRDWWGIMYMRSGKPMFDKCK